MIGLLASLGAWLPAAAADEIHRSGFEPLTTVEAVAMADDRSAALRLAIVEWYASTGVVPSLAQLGFADPQPVGPASATWGEAMLRLQFAVPLDGEQLAYAVWDQAGQWRWTCGHAPAPLDATLLSAEASSWQTTLADAVLPDACRSVPSAATTVREAWWASAPVLLGVLEYGISNGAYPDALADAGWPDPTPVARARLRLASGLLVATFDSPLAGETLAFAPWTQAGQPVWVCGHAPPPLDGVPASAATATAATSLDESDLPEPCQASPSLAHPVREVANAMLRGRLAVQEHWLQSNALPASLADLALADPLPVAQARLRLKDGVLIATFAGGELDGKTLAMAPYASEGQLLWSCGHAAAPAGVLLAAGTASQNTSLAAEWLPPACR